MFPDSAIKVVKAANEGKIQLVLRNPAEELKVAEAPAPRRVIPKPVIQKSNNVTVIRGTSVNSIKPKS